MTKETKELEALAAGPDTSPEKLRELAAQHPSLRPIIAMNPSAYPSLLTWLAGLHDPAVNVALEQRRAMKEAVRDESSGPQRISVLQRGGEPATSTGSLPTAPPPFTQPTSAQHASAQTANTQTANAQAAGTQASQVQSTVAMDPEELVAAQQAEQDKRRRITLLRFGALAVVLIVAVAALVWSLSRDTGQPAEEVVAVPSQSEELAEEEGTEGEGETAEGGEETAEETEPVVVYPAPEGALPLAHIVAPSGNIACTLGADGVVCSINSYSFTDASLANCASSPATLNTTEEGTTVSCSVAPVAAQGATTLSYGDYAVNEFGACYSTEYGMSCWNTTTGDSFAVARDGFMTGAEGLIGVNSMPWVG